MERVLDARGLTCPQPVIVTKTALEEAEAGNLVTVVDNEVARDNVVKFARKQDLRVEVEEKGNDYYIRIIREEMPSLGTPTDVLQRQVVLISSAALGRGDEELGGFLMQSFVTTLAQSDNPPAMIFLVNSGIKLACEESKVLESLVALEQKGTEILSCGTCLEYYRLKEKLCVGSITNMYTIVEALGGAEKVISL